MLLLYCIVSIRSIEYHQSPGNCGALCGALFSRVAIMAKITVKELEALTAEDEGRRLYDEGNLYGVVKARSGVPKAKSVAQALQNMKDLVNGVLKPQFSVLFRWRYRFDGKTKDFTCGTWPKSSLSDIRTEHKKARVLLDAGKDPSEAKRIGRIEASAEQAEALGQAQARIDAADEIKALHHVLDLF